MDKNQIKRIIREEVKNVLNEKRFPGFDAANQKPKKIIRTVEKIKKSLPNIRDIVNMQIQNPELSRDMKDVGNHLRGINKTLNRIIKNAKKNKY